MQQHGHAGSSVFAHSGVSFDDIMQSNACGGAGAVERYFEARRRMLVRDLSEASARGDDPAHLPRVLGAIDTALELLARLTEPAEDGQGQ